MRWMQPAPLIVASTLLPHWLTWEMRIGPGYIGKRIELACSSEPETCTSR